VEPGAGVCLADGQTSGDVKAVYLTGPPPEKQRGEARAEASPPGPPLVKAPAPPSRDGSQTFPSQGGREGF